MDKHPKANEHVRAIVVKPAMRPPASQAPRWRIPGVGVLLPRLDKVRLVSSATVGALKKMLPIDDLKRASHAADVVTPPGKFPGLRSTVWFVGGDDCSPCEFLATREPVLASYRIVEAEVAFDVAAKSDDEGTRKAFCASRPTSQAQTFPQAPLDGAQARTET